MYDQRNRLKTDSDLDAAWCAEERRGQLLLNFESPVTDLLLSSLKSPVTDGIIDIPDSPDWQADITWCFFLHSISDRFKALHQQCVLGVYVFLAETMELIHICPLLTAGYTGK